QRDGIGFSFVEILSPCPTIWGMDPIPARKWVAEHMIPVFPLQVFRDRKPEPVAEAVPPQRPLAEVLGLQTAEVMEPGEKSVRENSLNRLTVKIDGFGGQRVLLLSQLLVEVGVWDGYE